MRHNPPKVPADTTEEAWRVQMAALARRSTAERFEEFDQLNRAFALMHEQSVRRRHPDWNDDLILAEEIRLWYGEEYLALWQEGRARRP